jgi:hypothetical protein
MTLPSAIAQGLPTKRIEWRIQHAFRNWPPDTPHRAPQGSDESFFMFMKPA